MLPLGEHLVCGCLAPNLAKQTVMAILADLVQLEERAGQGGLETPFVKEIDVRFKAISLVVFVGDQTNFLETLKRHDGISMEDVVKKRVLGFEQY